jgi:hypothetical protein
VAPCRVRAEKLLIFFSARTNKRQQHQKGACVDKGGQKLKVAPPF